MIGQPYVLDSKAHIISVRIFYVNFMIHLIPILLIFKFWYIYVLWFLIASLCSKLSVTWPWWTVIPRNFLILVHSYIAWTIAFCFDSVKDIAGTAIVLWAVWLWKPVAQHFEYFQQTGKNLQSLGPNGLYISRIPDGLYSCVLESTSIGAYYRTVHLHTVMCVHMLCVYIRKRIPIPASVVLAITSK